MMHLKSLLLSLFLPFFVNPLLAGNSEKQEFIIEGNTFLYVHFPNSDSIHLRAQSDSIVSWTLDNQPLHGTVELKKINAQEAYLYYVPENPMPATETLVVSATDSDGISAEITILISIYDNKYHYHGEMLIDRIRREFYNGQFGLYAESINSDGEFQQAISYIWPASHLIRAFKTAYAINNEKYLRPLRNYSISLDQYLSSASGKVGYAAYPGEQGRFYDDNGLFAIQFAEVYPLINDQRLLNRAIIAYKFNHDDRDEHWGLPQHEDEYGQGMFYSMAVNQTGLSAALLYQLTSDPDYLSAAKQYYIQMNKPELMLRDATRHLFHQYVFFNNGSWSLTGVINGQQRNGAGFRAYQTTHVAQLAVELFKITNEEQYRTEARFLMDRCINYWVQSNGALNENSFWGGNDMIDGLIDIYNITADDRYLEVAKGIVDYLIDYGRDQSGYFPGDYDDRFGKWNLDRRDHVPTSVLLMGQAAAASAMLRVARAVDEGPVVFIPQSPLKPGNGFKIYPTVMPSGTTIYLENKTQIDNPVLIRIFSLDGKLHAHFEKQTTQDQPIEIPGIYGRPGVYLISIITPRGTYNEKIIIQ